MTNKKTDEEGGEDEEEEDEEEEDEELYRNSCLELGADWCKSFAFWVLVQMGFVGLAMALGIAFGSVETTNRGLVWS